MINNLSQLKKAIAEGREYIVVEHFIKPERAGEKRRPTKVQTNGYYSIVPGEPESVVSRANGGLGYWNTYGKAAEWSFDGDKITQYMNTKGEKLQTIMFI